MKLTNKQYDVAKYILLKVVPALIALLAGLKPVFDIDFSNIITVIGLLATTAGTLLGISSDNYHALDNKEATTTTKGEE